MYIIMRVVDALTLLNNMILIFLNCMIVIYQNFTTLIWYINRTYSYRILQNIHDTHISELYECFLNIIFCNLGINQNYQFAIVFLFEMGVCSSVGNMSRVM